MKGAPQVPRVPRVFRGDPIGTDLVHKYSPRLDAALSRLEQLVDWERQRRVVGEQRAMRVDCAPCIDLLRRLGDPHRSFKAIHVTGSKGKGSVSAMLTYALSEKKQIRTGWYRSPHVERVTERVGIDQQPIEDDALAQSLECTLDAKDAARETEGKEATWFDVLCAAGMHALASAQVEWAVVEVGMGGRRDSTNVLHAPYAVLTNVLLEHAEIIGPTLKDIAYEKVGIVHRDTFLVTGVQHGGADQEIFDIISSYCSQVGAAGVRTVPAQDGQCVNAPQISMLERNMRLANCVLDRMHADGVFDTPASLDLNEASHAMRTLPARMEVFQLEGGMSVIIDGAHVPESVEQVMNELREQRVNPESLVVVLGVGQEKNARDIVHAATKYGCTSLICTQVGPETTYLASDALYSQAKSVIHASAAIVGRLYNIPDPHQALQAALETNSDSAQNGEVKWVLVVGSLHLAGKVRPSVRQLAGRFQKQAEGR